MEQGSVPDDADILLVAALNPLNARQLFAMDQFLMEGGSAIIATSHYTVSFSRIDLAARKHDPGLSEWPALNRFTIEDKMVLDFQNASFPTPVNSNLGRLAVQEMQMVAYPSFVEVREDGIHCESALTPGLMQITINWPSPITINSDKNASRTVTTILGGDGSKRRDHAPRQTLGAELPGGIRTGGTVRISE